MRSASGGDRHRAVVMSALPSFRTYGSSSLVAEDKAPLRPHFTSERTYRRLPMQFTAGPGSRSDAS